MLENKSVEEIPALSREKGPISVVVVQALVYPQWLKFDFEGKFLFLFLMHLQFCGENNEIYHRLRTHNEGKISEKLGRSGRHASAVPKNLGVGVNFRPCSEGNFPSGRP